MTAAAHRRARWHASPQAVVGALLVTGVASFAVLRSSDVREDHGTQSDRAAIVSFAAEIERLSVDGGQIVTEGIKPGIADIADRALPDEVLAGMARGWVASMDEVRRAIAALDAPGELAAVAVRYERALITYVRTAETLLEASTAAGDRRAALIDLAISLGTDADRLYDEASDALAELQLTSTEEDR